MLFVNLCEYLKQGQRRTMYLKNSKEDVIPCNACGSRCCRYIVIEINKPSCKRDYDSIRWYLLHEDVNVFVDSQKTWHIEFTTDCQALNDDGKCSIYTGGKRPNICKDYGAEEGVCEYFCKPYVHYFSTVRQYENYLKKHNIDWKWKR